MHSQKVLKSVISIVFLLNAFLTGLAKGDVVCPFDHVQGFKADKAAAKAYIGEESLTQDQLRSGREIALWLKVKPGIEVWRDSFREVLDAAARPATAAEAKEQLKELCKPETYEKLYSRSGALDVGAAKELRARIATQELPGLDDVFYAQSNYQPGTPAPVKAALDSVVGDNANVVVNLLQFDGVQRSDREVYRIAEKQAVYFVDRSLFESKRFGRFSFGDTEPHRVRVVGYVVQMKSDGTFDVPGMPLKGVIPQGAIFMIDGSGLTGEQMVAAKPTLSKMIEADRGLKLVIRTAARGEEARLNKLTSGGAYALAHDPVSIGDIPTWGKWINDRLAEMAQRRSAAGGDFVIVTAHNDGRGDAVTRLTDRAAAGEFRAKHIIAEICNIADRDALLRFVKVAQENGALSVVVATGRLEGPEALLALEMLPDRLPSGRLAVETLAAAYRKAEALVSRAIDSNDPSLLSPFRNSADFLIKDGALNVPRAKQARDMLGSDATRLLQLSDASRELVRERICSADRLAGEEQDVQA
jgi:hypothetical protein